MEGIVTTGLLYQKLGGIATDTYSKYKEIFLPRFARHGSRFSSIARDLRGPGLRAYFWHAPKVGKNAPEPMVLDSLNYGGYLFCARGTVGFVCRTAVRFVSPCFSFGVRVGGPYRVAGRTHRGAGWKLVRLFCGLSIRYIPVRCCVQSFPRKEQRSKQKSGPEANASGPDFCWKQLGMPSGGTWGSSPQSACHHSGRRRTMPPIYSLSIIWKRSSGGYRQPP